MQTAGRCARVASGEPILDWLCPLEASPIHSGELQRMDISVLKRQCVLCGNTARDRNDEHVIPQWMLGLGNSAVRFDTFGNPFGRQLRIPFKNYAFAACAPCNKRYGKLEA